MIIRTKYSVTETFLPSTGRIIERLKEANITSVVLADCFNTLAHYEFELEKNKIYPSLKVFYGIEIAVKVENCLYRVIVFALNTQGLECIRSLNTENLSISTKGCPDIKYIQYHTFITLLKNTSIRVLDFGFRVSKGIDYDETNVIKNYNQFQKPLLKETGNYIFSPTTNYLDEKDRKMLMLMEGNRKCCQPAHFNAYQCQLSQILGKLPFSPVVFTKNKLPNSSVNLKDIIKNRMIELNLHKKQEYRDRVKYEMKIIEQKNFVQYFALVYDLVKEMRKVQMVGLGRGSAAGSLLCYLLDITQVDPVKYGLLFERFIDVDREDLPDIDIDFEDQSKAIQYLIKKYGHERVAHVSTELTFQWKTAIKEFTRVSRLTAQDNQKLNSVIDGEALASIAEKVKGIPNIDCALALIGYPKTFGTHASGIVVTEDPLSHTTMIQRKEDGSFIADVDKKTAEDRGLVKVDILGLNTLSQLHNILDALGKGVDFLPKGLDDPKVYEAMRNNKLAGIFQFSGGMLRSGVKTTQPQNFNDAAVLTALMRPGPLSAGMLKTYTNNRKKNIGKYSENEDLDRILAPTSGVIVYQEQTMEIAHILGGLSLVDTNKIRKLISKFADFDKDSTAKEIHKNFIENCSKLLGENEANRIWGEIKAMGAYQFNKSHAICYTHLSFYLLWLKVYHPDEFYMGTLNTFIDKQDLLISVVIEMIESGYTFTKEPNLSKSFELSGKLQFSIPLTVFKGIGEKKAQMIINRGELTPNDKKLISNGSLIDKINKYLYLYEKEKENYVNLTRGDIYKIADYNVKNKVEALFGTFDQTFESDGEILFLLKDADTTTRLKVKDNCLLKNLPPKSNVVIVKVVDGNYITSIADMGFSLN